MVRKSRARVGVSTPCRVRNTASGEWRRRVRRKCDCREGGRAAKWETRLGRLSNVVSARSGWMGGVGC
jgi:hypothetical protein